MSLGFLQKFEKPYQTPRSRLENLGCACFSNLLLCVWISDEIRFLVFYILLLKLINNSSRENKENHYRDSVWICDTNYHKILPTLASNFSKNNWSFEKQYQTLESVFHQISRHFEVVKKKSSAAPRSFNLLLSVSISDETLFLVFDILLHKFKI